jgi:tRNA 2-thiocytidine biosynthesis protein TtcA
VSQLKAKNKTNKRARSSKLEYFFSKKVGQAIACYDMLHENDNILVGVSGGKDSMSLLKILRYKQKALPIDYNITACYVDMGLDKKRRMVIEDYLQDNGYRYIIKEAQQWQSRKKKDGSLNCYWCASSRRKVLFETADAQGCNKIALGHHKDDIAETFLLNLFFHGEISTMVPNQEFFKGRFRIIRPLALCDEKFVIRYAKESGFPDLKDLCSNSYNSKRMFMKNILRMVSEFNDDVKTNIFRSMERISHDYIIKTEGRHGYRKKR